MKKKERGRKNKDQFPIPKRFAKWSSVCRRWELQVQRCSAATTSGPSPAIRLEFKGAAGGRFRLWAESAPLSSLFKMAAGGLFGGLLRRSVPVVLGRSRRALWGLSRKEREPPVMEAAEEVKEEPTLACPPPPSRKYLPPEDLESRLESLVKEVFGASLPADWRKATLEKSQLKFHLLAQLAEELGHVVPNSRLHQMNSAQDVLAFYSIPVQDQSKFDELCSSELPANLKITWEY
ncbi:39S ribosomal protein L50, mitochondrial [Ornithorhynchus anatinus]|nr:39S ribosomal protein L50, mitochondrial [Ornithorhynchus anatinus]